MLYMSNKQQEICFLCGKTRSEVNKLIRGKFGYACDSCVQIAYDTFNEQEEEEISHNVQLVTPSQIKAHLDQYVIGQDEAKKTLSVAVYTTIKG